MEPGVLKRVVGRNKTDAGLSYSIKSQRKLGSSILDIREGNKAFSRSFVVFFGYC
jgi:hypothetical protein